MHALTVHNISFSYTDSIPTLSGVSLEVRAGEILSIVGPNGSGKSTLLRLLNRTLLPHSGAIQLFDQPLSTYSREAIARQIGCVPQDAGIQFPFTAREIVMMGRAPHSRGAVFENAHDRDLADQMMVLMDIIHLADHPVTALSGGERQRVFIARALAQQPRVLLLDEPNAHLDIAHQVEVFRILRKLNRDSGLTVISVSHDLNLAASFSDRVAMLLCGSLVVVGVPHEVLTQERIGQVFRARVLVDRHPTEPSTRITLLTSSSP